MTDFNAEHVSIAAVPHLTPDDVIERRIKRVIDSHDGPVDALVVLVPVGTWREARERIWEGLGTREVEQTSDLTTAVYYEGNIGRLAEADAYSGRENSDA
jgi:hypothetical protein